MTLFNIYTLEALIERHNINLLNLIFIIFTITIVVFGSLLALVETRLPASIRQSFRYGKHSYKGTSNPLIERLEIPKSWFKHFYIFALGWSLITLGVLFSVVWSQETAPEYILRFLDFMAGGAKNRQLRVDSNSAVIGTILLTMQCIRRFYEVIFIQIFSKKSKINFSHYIVGHVHYFGAFVALLVNTAGFVRGTTPEHLTLKNVTGVQIACIAFFVASWHQQYCANILLVKLRKDTKTGTVKTENHLMPNGGSFNFISSPHMFFEIVMYICLAILLGSSISWWFICMWVVSNQVSNALLTHEWYRQTFKQYPRHRRAIIPFLI